MAPVRGWPAYHWGLWSWRAALLLRLPWTILGARRVVPGQSISWALTPPRGDQLRCVKLRQLPLGIPRARIGSAVASRIDGRSTRDHGGARWPDLRAQSADVDALRERQRTECALDSFGGTCSLSANRVHFAGTCAMPLSSQGDRNSPYRPAGAGESRRCAPSFRTDPR